MKVGILNACSPAEEVEFNAREFDNFQKLFSHVDHELTFAEYRITEGEFPQAADECDAYLITGSPKGVYDSDLWIAQLGDFIRASYAEGAKMVGVCFGHQILAHALGGYTTKSEKGWGMGPATLEIAQPQPWMTPPLPQGDFYFCHQDQVMQLPAEAQRLAGNEFCPNGMFIIGRQVLGVQAHPEFTEPIMRKAIDALSSQMEPQRLQAIEAAIAQRETDSPVMAQWIVNFLEDANPPIPQKG